MNKNVIVLSAEPKGKFLSGIIVGTPKPGTLMMMDNVAFSGGGGGQPSWVPLAPTGGDGKSAPIYVLMEDYLQGKGVADAYVTGTPGQLYAPLPGEMVNVRVGEGGGTSNSVTIGDLLMVDAEDGILVPNSSGTVVPFTAMETLTELADDSLVACMRN